MVFATFSEYLIFILHCRLIACIAFLQWLVTFCLRCSSCSLGLWGTHGCSVCSQKSLAQRTKYTLSTGFATILALGPSMDGKDRFSIADRTIWLFPTRANSWTPQNLVFSERERRSSFPPPISDLDRQLQTCRLACCCSQCHWSCYSFLMIFPPAPLPVFLEEAANLMSPALSLHHCKKPHLRDAARFYPVVSAGYSWLS